MTQQNLESLSRLKSTSILKLKLYYLLNAECNSEKKKLGEFIIIIIIII